MVCSICITHMLSFAAPSQEGLLCMLVPQGHAGQAGRADEWMEQRDRQVIRHHPIWDGRQNEPVVSESHGFPADNPVLRPIFIFIHWEA